MGLLDQLAGQVLNSLGTPSTGGKDNALLAIAQQLIQQNGGLDGLLAKLRSGGLAEQAASWVGTGRNLPVQGAQLEEVLGGGALARLAGQFGMDASQASAGLAEVLPQLIDRATPQGTTDNADAVLTQGLEALGAFFAKR